MYSVLVLILALFGASNGQDCCPDGGWGELLRKDGDPVYEDKGVVEQGTKLPFKAHFKQIGIRVSIYFQFQFQFPAKL